MAVVRGDPGPDGGSRPATRRPPFAAGQALMLPTCQKRLPLLDPHERLQLGVLFLAVLVMAIEALRRNAHDHSYRAPADYASWVRCRATVAGQATDPEGRRLRPCSRFAPSG
jgi:hypothetical protein